jgi:hypothetical protein
MKSQNIYRRRLTFIEVAMIAKEDTLQRQRMFTDYTYAIPAEPD